MLSLSWVVDVDGPDLFLNALIVRCSKGVVCGMKRGCGRVSTVNKVDAECD